jgi:hypothetical protein
MTDEAPTPAEEPAAPAPQPASPNAGLREQAKSIAVRSNVVSPASMAELMDFAQLMAKGGPMVGKSFRDNPGACMGIAMQAMQWRFSPYAVSQKAYVTKDKDGNEQIGYEAQLINAVINTHAPIKEPLEYIYEGEGAARICVIQATLVRGSKPSVYRSPPAGAIMGRSPLWKTDLDQQLGYYSSRAWARRYCPEVIMGVYTPEEIEESHAIEVTPVRVDGVDYVREQDGEQIATTIIRKSSYRAKKDGDDKWLDEQIALIESEEDAAALEREERFMALPRGWYESTLERIEKRLEEFQFEQHQAEHDITSHIAAKTKKRGPQPARARARKQIKRPKKPIKKRK